MANAKCYDIAVVGLSCVDCVAHTDAIQMHVMNPISDVAISGGGLGNALTALSGLGLQVAVASRIGQDLYGDYLLRQWRALEMDIAAVTRDAERQTGFSFILNQGDERTPLFSIGANASFCLKDIPLALVESSRTLLVFFAGVLPALDGAPLLELAKKCNASRTAIIVDVSDNTHADYSAIASYMPFVNLVVNEEEGFRLTGEKGSLDVLHALDAACDAGAMFRGVTRKDGVMLSLPAAHGRQYLDVPSPCYGRPVRNVSGAGDAFRAGLAAYISRHYNAYLAGTLDYSAACRFAAGVSYLHLSRMSDCRPFSWEDVSVLVALKH